MSPRGKKNTEAAPSYKQGFSELQEIVAKLESGTATLEEALALYARGKELLKVCSDLLERAELHVRALSIPDEKTPENNSQEG